MKTARNSPPSGPARRMIPESSDARWFPAFRHWMPAALALLCLFVLGPSSLRAQMVTVNPVEAPGPLSNPMMGFRSYPNNDHPYGTVFQQYIPWNQIENHDSDTVQKIRDYCNALWANLPADNVKVIPRVYLDWDGGPGNEHWPADLQSGDWTSQQFKDRVVRLIGRLGEVWDNDPRVAWVQTGIIGHWGEQESPVGVGQDGWVQRMGDAFTAAFKNKKFIVRNMDAWPGYGVGVYWDSFGHPWQPGVSDAIRNLNNQGRYLTQVVEGEVAYNWGEPAFDPLYGGEPEFTLNNAQYTDNMIDVIRELHCSTLGWISHYALDGRYGTDPNSIRTNAARMQKEFGYRFHITEFSCSARTEPGANLDVRFKVQNKGSAPFYENWPVAVVLINETTRQIVWKATLPNVDTRTWHPGSNYSYTTRTYQTPALEHEISASIPLPPGIAAGQYLVGLTILEPLSRTPGVFFAVPNFFKQSQTQPLCRIGVGADAGSHTLDGVTFDDPVNDQARSYAMTPQGPNHTLTLVLSPLGVISQPAGDGIYPKDTGVLVKATGNLGYGFISWGGALAGSTKNPEIVVMDASKSLSANYVPIPVHRLTTSSTNGSISLNPPGGFYNMGTEVTVTATPSSGYAFVSWSGDLGGSANPVTITMTGDKLVTANFTVATNNGPTEFRVNCGGAAHTAGDGSVFGADTGGNIYSTTSPIAGTTDDTLYQSERYGGSFGYSIPLANGEYDVTLMFAEIYFNAANSRVFNVAIEGNQVITGLDIFSRVGKNSAYDEHHTVTVSDGQLNIAFSGTTDNAKISAIKVKPKQRLNPRTLLTSATNGSVSLNPPGGVYDDGTVVTVTAFPSSGYSFNSWGGDLAGSLNPATITMTGNKSVTVNFPLIPTYTLTTSSANGLISFDPPGGIYNEGTVVTVTATPDSGHTFGSWSGDLTGSTNPATVTMNGNKSVTANFPPIPTYTLTTSATHGSVSLSPTGGVYYEGTVVTVTGAPGSGYTFSSWSGDLAGSINPTPITMNGNKSVTANFAFLPPASKVVLLVVGNAGNLGASDTAVRDHLQNNGYIVQVVTDALASVGDATGKALIIASSTVVSGNVNTKFRDVTVPVINWETALQDDFRFTGNTAADLGTAGSQTQLNITNPGHPLAAGLPAGVRPVATVAGGFSWGEPGGSPIIIARLTNGGNQPCLYAYEAGGAMTGGTAPARRVHLFLQNDTFAVLNANGLKLFDAAVGWAMGLDVPSWSQPPVIQGGFLRLEWTGGGTLQTSPNLQEPWVDIPDAVSPYLHPVTNPAQFFRVRK